MRLGTQITLSLFTTFALGFASGGTPLMMHHIGACDECGRLQKGGAGSWCQVPPKCTAFVWDTQHVQGSNLSVLGCASLPCDAPTFCLKGGYDLWVATNASEAPCPHPYHPPPAPPYASALWHLPARCEEGDVNALFEFEGTWHLMQQWKARPRTSIGHAVSTDLLRWARLPDVLSSGQGSDEQCYDGSSSIVVRHGVRTPMLMIDGGCGEKGAGSIGCMESHGDGSTGGVTAFPRDLADVNLSHWERSRGPTVFVGCDGSAGPSPILLNAATGRHQLIAIHGVNEALFEALDDTFTKWTMSNPAFLPARGGGGGLWRVLPPDVGGARVTVAPLWTHIMQLNGAGLHDGGASFALLAVDEASSTVRNLSTTAALDVGRGVVYGQLSSSGGTTRGGAPGDPRTVHVSWLNDARRNDSTCAAQNIDVGQLTSFRDVRFDSRLGDHGGLVESPISEYYKLRRRCVNRTADVRLLRTPTPVVTLGAGPSAADIELNLTIPPSGTSVHVGVACGVKPSSCGLKLNLTISGPPTGLRSVSMALWNAASTGGRNETSSMASSEQPAARGVTAEATFALLPGEDLLPLRVMTDLGSIEVFAGGGRGVYSGGLSYAACELNACLVTAAASNGGAGALPDVSLAEGAAWELGSIFDEELFGDFL